MAYGSELSCYKCNKVKPETEFYLEPRNTGRNGRYSACKECSKNKTFKYKELNRDKVRLQQRISKRKKLTNFTNEMFESKLMAQENLCAICKTDTPGGRGSFHADHDHATGQARGVLCHNCNIALGNFKDNPEILQAAIEYLKKYSEVE